MVMGGMAGEDNPMPMPDMPDAEPMAAMHMTFFWGKNVDVLFSGWPGYDRLGMYLLALLVVFLISAAVELLSAARMLKPGDGSNRLVAGLAQTLIYAVKMGLAYMVMLAVMSFNGGVLLAAVVGHAVGFLVFKSGAFRRQFSQLPLNDRSAAMKG